MLKKRNVMTVEVDLDAMPGFNHSPEDMVNVLQMELNRMCPHYNPKVTHETTYPYDPTDGDFEDDY